MISPYLHFRGACRAALTRYREILGGELSLMRYAEMPGNPTAFAGVDLIMHGQLDTPAHGTLMASDFPPGVAGDPQQAVSVSLTCAGADAARGIYDALLDGGEPVQPFQATFFSPGFGMLKDRFGTHWIVMAQPAAG